MIKNCCKYLNILLIMKVLNILFCQPNTNLLLLLGIKALKHWIKAFSLPLLTQKNPKFKPKDE